MPIPLALWAAAGIGAAGMKLYMNLNSPETVVRNATERYNEERYKFYKQMERLVPLIEELGRLKLSTWSKYTAMFDTLDKLINLPGEVSPARTFARPSSKREATCFFWCPFFPSGMPV